MGESHDRSSEPAETTDTTPKMHNRRGPLLPFKDDFEGEKSSGKRIKSKRGHKNMYGFGKFLLLIVTSGIIVVALQRSFLKKSNERDADFRGVHLQHDLTLDDEEQRQLNKQMPFDPFPSLQSFFQTSDADVVALYFAASWCPMSTPITNLLDELFRDILVSASDKRLAIVYVSSDKDVASFDAYVKPGWKTVPYANTEERCAIKRHFRTCAKREMEEVGLTTRDYEIPNLIILAGKSQQLITYAGIQDIKELRDAAVDHWVELKRLQTALETKHDIPS